MADHPEVRVKFHNWWNAPSLRQGQAIDPVASHASWMENFPGRGWPVWRMPDEQKPMTTSIAAALGPAGAAGQLGDGNFGGRYQRPDADMLAIWKVAVEETRELIEGPWA